MGCFGWLRLNQAPHRNGLAPVRAQHVAEGLSRLRVQQQGSCRHAHRLSPGAFRPIHRRAYSMSRGRGGGCACSRRAFTAVAGDNHPCCGVQCGCNRAWAEPSSSSGAHLPAAVSASQAPWRGSSLASSLLKAAAMSGSRLLGACSTCSPTAWYDICSRAPDCVRPCCMLNMRTAAAANCSTTMNGLLQSRSYLQLDLVLYAQGRVGGYTAHQLHLCRKHFFWANLHHLLPISNDPRPAAWTLPCSGILRSHQKQTCLGCVRACSVEMLWHHGSPEEYCCQQVHDRMYTHRPAGLLAAPARVHLQVKQSEHTPSDTSQALHGWQYLMGWGLRSLLALRSLSASVCVCMLLSRRTTS